MSRSIFMVVAKTVFLAIVCAALFVSTAQAQHDPYDNNTLLEFYWDAPLTGVVHHYNVYLSIDDGNYSKVGETPDSKAPTIDDPYPLPITAEDGRKYQITVEAEAANGMVGPMSEPSDPVWCILAEIGATPATLTFDAVAGGVDPDDQILSITNTYPGDSTLNWTVSDDANWLSCAPPSGDCTNETDEVTVSVDISGLADGTYDAEITISATGVSNSPQTVLVTLNVFLLQWDMPLGWNFISIPVQLSNNALDRVLQSIAGSYDSVLTYDATNGKWKRHIVNGPGFLNDLTTIEQGKGYLIKMTAPAVLIPDGGKVADNPITLELGWNLIGYSGLTPRLIEEALSYMGYDSVDYDSVWTYDASNGEWKRHVVDGPEDPSELKIMEPGKAYWIDVTAK